MEVSEDFHSLEAPLAAPLAGAKTWRSDPFFTTVFPYPNVEVNHALQQTSLEI